MHCIAVVMLVLQTATSLMTVEKDMPLLVFKMSTSVTVPSETTYSLVLLYTIPPTHSLQDILEFTLLIIIANFTIVVGQSMHMVMSP